MANSTLCPYPFLPLSSFPETGGFVQGRFCGPVTPTEQCCLPCPLQQWVSSDSYERKAEVAIWFNLPGLVCQLFLLLGFAVLPKEVSGRHYLSVGLCVSLVLLELSFIIPLGTKPDECFDEITPGDMYTSMSCGWSGALLELGAMAAVVWILLRSLWTHLRVCWDLKHTHLYIWLAHILGWGLPFLFLAISLPLTGVAYRLGRTCIPNPHGAFVTWFGWLIAFGCLSCLIQLATTTFCMAIYMRSFFRHDSSSLSTTTTTSNPSTTPVAPKPNNCTTTTSAVPTDSSSPAIPIRTLSKRLAWKRVHKVLLLQWRSIVLSLFVIVETIYFGTIYAAQVRTAENDARPEHSAEIFRWTECLVESGGEKEDCIHLARGLSLGEDVAVASFFMVSLIGMFTFGLMVRWSMLVGWWALITNPRKRRKSSGADEFVLVKTKRTSLGKILGSDKPQTPEDPDVSTMPRSVGVLPSPEKDRQMSVPEPGDVATRHETTNLFDDGESEEGEGEAGEKDGPEWV